MSNDAPFGVIPKTPAEVAKALVYTALTAGGLLITARGDKVVTLDEIITIVIVVVGLIPVYWIAGTRAKTAVAFVLAALNALNVIFIGGVAGFGDVTLDDWILVGIQAFAAIGVAVTPNSPPLAKAVIVNNHGDTFIGTTGPSTEDPEK